ncbi:MAG: hypothetical protein AB1810_08500 [Pseudomonadota bacterium]
MSVKIISAVLGLGLAAAAAGAMAASDAAFPKGWKDWPIKHTGAIPGSSTPIPSGVPVIVQETVKTYNWVQDGKGSKYNVRVNPAQDGPYKARSGKFGDGPTAVLELTDIKAILVTEHLLGEPVYGAYTYEGKDISDAHASLKPQVCKTCHSGYGEACVVGVCSK